MNDKLRIKFWGVRGSYPAPGAGTIRYGRPPVLLIRPDRPIHATYYTRSGARHHGDGIGGNWCAAVQTLVRIGPDTRRAPVGALAFDMIGRSDRI